jgi:hypothetical protein
LVIPTTRTKDTVGPTLFDKFPVEHYSYSAFVKFGSNPIMFKINIINKDYIDTTLSVSTVLGKACHKALQAYLGGDKDHPTPADDGEAIKHGHAVGLEYLTNYSDGFIEFNDKIPDRAKLQEKYAYCYFGYIKDFDFKNEVKEVVSVEQKMEYTVEVNGKLLPIPLKGYIDLLYRDHQDRLKIRDHKFTGAYSKEDKIDGGKLVQAVFYYFLSYAFTGTPPYSTIFAEFKTSENRDKSPQTKLFEIVFNESSLPFELFYRLYDDITNALLGKQVYVPNFSTIFDNEVSILAYIHRLDVDEERAKVFKELKVDNITDFLKKKIQKEGAMKKYLEQVSSRFVSGETLNYKNMTIPEKIKMKLAEHGLGVEFFDMIKGNSITLYRFEPSIGLKMSKIEAYAKDIEQVVEVSNIRLLCPIRDSGLIGFEVPNTVRTFPILKNTGNDFNLHIGVDILGKDRIFDIRSAPHLLVSGSTGSGKSHWLNIIIGQLMKIKNVELHLFDPKQVELSHFEKKVEEYADDPVEISKSLRGLIREMKQRYTLMKKLGVRNIDQIPDWKYKFVVIDEFADLNMNGEVGESIQRLAQKGRACGIHLIIATQRASTKVISGDVKINFNVRVVFRMAKEVDSRVMIDEAGAEKLLGRGDMLFLADQGVERLQGYEK